MYIGYPNWTPDELLMCSNLSNILTHWLINSSKSRRSHTSTTEILRAAKLGVIPLRADYLTKTIMERDLP